MALHLVKLCVGCDSLEDLAAWIDFRLEECRANGVVPEQFHTTRMVPKRQAELLDGGSLYWVIKGNIQARQRLLEVRTFTGEDGIGRCHLVLEPKVIPTIWQPRRAFQGWRYIADEEVPQDDRAGAGGGMQALPVELRRELAVLGLI
ncbi:DUF1489 family protein [Pseudochrobactrum asaccharolyticum]|uniref:DUF1489 family protein n=1 Tax=Pseudochrobactrum asaccharolyticum TaxID=354351 RepID=A0A366E9J5_9HYPH|nr:DUF1489 family protein [Pseudochrobactrum asaccharolyticum]RBO99053.1 hypothetical protein DFR47_101662 [Pseudochrobactrum asaccharolyticum]